MEEFTLTLTGFPSWVERYDIWVVRFRDDRVLEEHLLEDVPCDSTRVVKLDVRNDGNDLIGIYLHESDFSNPPIFFWGLDATPASGSREVSYWLNWNLFVQDPPVIEFGASRTMAVPLPESLTIAIDFATVPYLLYSLGHLGAGIGEARTFDNKGSISVENSFNHELTSWNIYAFSGVDPEASSHVHYLTYSNVYLRVRPADYAVPTSGIVDFAFWHHLQHDGPVWEMVPGGEEFSAFGTMSNSQTGILSIVGVRKDTMAIEPIVTMPAGIGVSDLCYSENDGLLYAATHATDTPVYAIDVSDRTIEPLNQSVFAKADHLAVSPTLGRLIVQYQTSITLYDLETGSLAAGPFSADAPGCTGMAFDDETHKLFLAIYYGSSASLRRYTIESDGFTLEQEEEVAGTVWQGLALSPDGSTIATVTDAAGPYDYQATLELFRSDDFTLLYSVPESTDAAIAYGGIAFDQPGEVLYYTNAHSGGLYVLDTADYHLRRVLWVPEPVYGYSHTFDVIPTEDGVMVCGNFSDTERLYFLRGAAHDPVDEGDVDTLHSRYPIVDQVGLASVARRVEDLRASTHPRWADPR
jgi:hypothetical protein